MSGYKKPTFLGLLQAFDSGDTFYGEPGRGKRIRKVNLKGGPMQINWAIGSVEWQGSEAGNPDWEQRRIPWQDNLDVTAGTVLPSAHEVVEGVDKYKVNRLANNEQVADFVQMKADRLVEGYITRTNKDFFPATNLVGGAGVAPGKSKKALTSISYALQTGYAGNELTGAGTYEYLGHDLNTIPEAKALNVGTDAVPWTVTPRKIIDEILMPLREERGSNPDLILMPQTVYSYLAAFFEGKQIINDNHPLVKWGVRFFEIDGVPCVYEPRLNLLPKKEIYFLSMETWVMGMDESPAEALVYLENIPGIPSGSGYQGYIESALACESPRQNARAYNVITP